MDPNYLRVPGIAFVLIGVFVALSSFSGITGFAIADEVEGSFGYLFGFVFLAIGIALFFAGWRVSVSLDTLKSNVRFDSEESRRAARADYFRRFQRMPTQEEAFSYERQLEANGKIFEAVLRMRNEQ